MEGKMKLLTITIPSYNSEAYMRNCIESLLPGGEDVEILVVDDGSGDRTGEIADEYEKRYPGIVRAIHQENGGHGAAVNTGLEHASGLYFKVVDSDDWVKESAYRTILQTLRELAGGSTALDMLISNFVYEKEGAKKNKVMRYHHALPKDRIFTWDEVKHFRKGQYILMHSVIFRTKLLKECGLKLPEHTFYVDNIFVYQPLPAVKTLYYMDLDLYRYFIGRADQSVNEQVMVTRVDQQLRVTRLMIDAHNLKQIKAQLPKLGRYMTSYLSMMMTISSIFLIIDGSPAALGKKTELWEYLRTVDRGLYHKLKYRSVSMVGNIPGYQGRRLSVSLYRMARKIYKFN